MNAIRRWYIYLVCAISLNVVAWSVIALGRNILLAGIGANPLAAARNCLLRPSQKRLTLFRPRRQQFASGAARRKKGPPP